MSTTAKFFEHAHERHHADSQADAERRHTQVPFDLLLERRDHTHHRRGDANDGFGNVVDVDGLAHGSDVITGPSTPPAGRLRKAWLGALMAKLGHTAAAMPSLAKAVALLPDDAQAWINLAMALEQTEQWNAADAAYQNVMRLEGFGELGQRAEEGRSRIAGALCHRSLQNAPPVITSKCTTSDGYFLLG